MLILQRLEFMVDRKGAEYSLMFLTKYDGIKCAVLNSPSDRVYEGLKGKRNSKHSSWTYG